MEQLIKRAKDGDIDAYTEAFMKVRSDLRKFALNKLSDKSLVEDVLQDVYYKAYKNLGKLDDNTKFKNWITTILRNECMNINNYAKAHMESDVDEIIDILEDTSASTFDSKIFFEDMIKNLTEEEKTLLRLKYKEAYTNEEISEKFGLPYNTVKSKILRAIKKITLIVLVLIMLTGFTALAAFVIKQIKAHFTTSLNAINTAVENNYVQEIDSDFIYDNGIGIRVDAIVLDDKNLDISFVYDVQDKEKYGEITGIRLEEYVVKSDNEIIFDSKNDDRKLTKSIRQYPEKFEVTEDKYMNSILLTTSSDFPMINNIIIEISDLIINANEDYLVNGNWRLNYSVIDELNSREKTTYIMEENDYVKYAEVVLNEMSVQIDVELNIEEDISNIEEISLYNNDKNSFLCTSGKFLKTDKILKMAFDLSKYMDNISELTLEIPRENDENIIIKFRRDG